MVKFWLRSLVLLPYIKSFDKVVTVLQMLLFSALMFSSSCHY